MAILHLRRATIGEHPLCESSLDQSSIGLIHVIVLKLEETGRFMARQSDKLVSCTFWVI